MPNSLTTGTPPQEICAVLVHLRQFPPALGDFGIFFRRQACWGVSALLLILHPSTQADLCHSPLFPLVSPPFCLFSVNVLFITKKPYWESYPTSGRPADVCLRPSSLKRQPLPGLIIHTTSSGTDSLLFATKLVLLARASLAVEDSKNLVLCYCSLTASMLLLPVDSGSLLPTSWNRRSSWVRLHSPHQKRSFKTNNNKAVVLSIISLSHCLL